MNIKIFESIDDPFLKKEWGRLEKEIDIFPQSTYHWCATWWKHLSGNRKLHAVMVLDDKGQALTIAPLCIERNFGIPILRSFPIHFGDFYAFISANNSEAPEAIDSILKYLESYRKWYWVRLEQVPETNELVEYLKNHYYQKKRLTGCVIADFNKRDWEGYLSDLKSSFRKHLRRRLKQIEAQFKVELIIIKSWQEYANQFHEMMQIYKDRWVDDNMPEKGCKELECWKEAIKGQFDSGRLVYFKLLFDCIPVAYRLGFIHQKTYYAWHTSVNNQYRSFHTGVIMLAIMVKHLMKNNVVKINFMAGEYDWKLDWSPNQCTVSNYMFTASSKDLRGVFLTWYYHEFRDKLKAFYHKMMEHRSLRFISRYTILVRQILAGNR